MAFAHMQEEVDAIERSATNKLKFEKCRSKLNDLTTTRDKWAAKGEPNAHGSVCAAAAGILGKVSEATLSETERQQLIDSTITGLFRPAIETQPEINARPAINGSVEITRKVLSNPAHTQPHKEFVLDRVLDNLLSGYNNHDQNVHSLTSSAASEILERIIQSDLPDNRKTHYARRLVDGFFDPQISNASEPSAQHARTGLIKLFNSWIREPALNQAISQHSLEILSKGYLNPDGKVSRNTIAAIRSSPDLAPHLREIEVEHAPIMLMSPDYDTRQEGGKIVERESREIFRNDADPRVPYIDLPSAYLHATTMGLNDAQIQNIIGPANVPRMRTLKYQLNNLFNSKALEHLVNSQLTFDPNDLVNPRGGKEFLETIHKLHNNDPANFPRDFSHIPDGGPIYFRTTNTDPTPIQVTATAGPNPVTIPVGFDSIPPAGTAVHQNKFKDIIDAAFIAGADKIHIPEDRIPHIKTEIRREKLDKTVETIGSIKYNSDAGGKITAKIEVTSNYSGVPVDYRAVVLSAVRTRLGM